MTAWSITIGAETRPPSPAKLHKTLFELESTAYKVPASRKNPDCAENAGIGVALKSPSCAPVVALNTMPAGSFPGSRTYSRPPANAVPSHGLGRRFEPGESGVRYRTDPPSVLFPGDRQADLFGLPGTSDCVVLHVVLRFHYVYWFPDVGDLREPLVRYPLEGQDANLLEGVEHRLEAACEFQSPVYAVGDQSLLWFERMEQEDGLRCSWIRRYKPMDRAGYAIYIYDFTKKKNKSASP